MYFPHYLHETRKQRKDNQGRVEATKNERARESRKLEKDTPSGNALLDPAASEGRPS